MQNMVFVYSDDTTPLLENDRKIVVFWSKSKSDIFFKKPLDE